MSLPDLTSLALPLAYLGAGIGVAMVVPQILRTVRHPDLSGVSAVSWGLLAVACTTWLTYGVRAHVPPQVPGNVLLVTGAWTIVLLVPHRLSVASRALRLGAATAAVVGLTFLLPPAAGGYLGFAIGLTSVWPQVVETWALRHDGASGLSLPTWGLKAASQSCWLTYATLMLDVPVLISATVALSATSFVLAVEARRRARSVEWASPHCATAG